MTYRSLFVLALLGIGCGGSTDGGSGSGGTGTGGTATGGTGTGGSATGGTGTGGTGTGGAGTGGYATGGASGSGGGNVGGNGGATSTCVTDQDCGYGICGYLVSAGCAAVGECFATPGPICDAYSPACACDGTVVSVICEGLPDGYAKKPVEHVGACDVGGPFACGPNLTCNSQGQYCKIGLGGAAGSSPTYSCEATPATCQGNYSCACIQKAVGAQTCSETGGGVSVTYYYP